MQIVKSLDDGALTSEEAADLVELMVKVLKDIRPLIKVFWLRIALDGCAVALSELQEHLAECNKENAMDCKG
jgi:hypothetical protein